MKLRIAAVIFVFISLTFILVRTISQEGSGWNSAQQGTNSKPSLNLQTKEGAIILPFSLVNYETPSTTTTTPTPSTTTTTAPPPTVPSTPTTTTASVSPSTTQSPVPTAHNVQSGDDSTNAFTSNWYRCVINPESGGNFSDTSGGYGILVSTWQSYGMSGVPGDYSAEVQAGVALRLFAANGGFGSNCWNNSAGCGKSG